MVTNRQSEILKIIIEEFSKRKEPIGSKYIVNNNLLNCSSATIRNEMAILEKKGFISKSNSSAGRVPLEKGYNYYNEHVNFDQVGIELFENLVKQGNILDAQDIQKSIDLICQMTNHATVFIKNKKDSIADIKLVPISQTDVIIILVSSSGEVQNKKIPITTDIEINKVEKIIELIKPEIKDIPIDQVTKELKNNLVKKLELYVENYEKILEFIFKIINNFVSGNVYLSDGNLNVKNYKDIEELQAVYEFIQNPTKIVKSIEKVNQDIITKVNESNNTSVVSLKLKDKDNNENIISVVGPRNMDYQKTTTILKLIKQQLEE